MTLMESEIKFNIKNPLFCTMLICLLKIILWRFQSGAYQEVLGMQHNLFTHPTEATAVFNKDGNYEVEDIIQAQNLIDILDDMDYAHQRDRDKTKTICIVDSRLISEDKKKEIMGELYVPI